MKIVHLQSKTHPQILKLLIFLDESRDDSEFVREEDTPTNNGDHEEPQPLAFHLHMIFLTLSPLL